jgi:hypothetical protein
VPGPALEASRAEEVLVDRLQRDLSALRGLCRMVWIRGQEPETMIFVGSGEVLAFIEDGPHGGETLFIDAGSDGLPPQEIELSTPGACSGRSRRVR